MKNILIIFSFLLLTICSTHTVKLGKKCTMVALNDTYEKSFVWIVNRENLEDSENKINKENCQLNGEKL